MTEPLSPSTRTLLFARIRDDLARALTNAVREALPRLADDLEAVGERSPSPRDRQSLYATAALLRIDAAERVGRVARALADRAQRCVEASEIEDPQSRALALIDEDELDEQILGGELARVVREIAGTAYASYAGRMANLSSRGFGDDDLNPLGARTLATAAVAALRLSAESGAAKVALRQWVPARLGGPIAQAVRDADAALASAGVPVEPLGEPSAHAPARREEAVGADAGPSAHEPPERPAPADEMPELPHAAPLAVQADRDAGVLGTSPLAAPATKARLKAVPVLQSVSGFEQDAIAFAHAAGVSPYTRPARQEFFGRVRASLRASGASAAQLAVVDVVGAMFDYVVDDRRLPEAAKPLVWRLQQPAVALSLLDPDYLGDDPRSLRRLVENFGAIAIAFSDDLVRGSELHKRLDTVVRAVEIVTSALQTRSAVMAEQVEKEYSRAARSVEQLIDRVGRERQSLESMPGRRNRRNYSRRPGLEQEREVTERIERFLAERLDASGAPDSVRDFVMRVWLRRMRTAALRDGEESAEYKVAVRVLDDLLWSLDESGERKSRRELAERIPPLIRLLTQGVHEIGARDEEFKAFFDELFLIHLRRMQKRSRDGTTTFVPTGLQPTQPGAPAVPTLGEALGPGSAAAPEALTPPPPPPPAPEMRAPEMRAPETRPPETRPPEAPRPAMPAVPPQPPAEEAESTDQRLLEILSSLDLGDLPAHPQRRELPAPESVAAIRRGDWVELVGRDGSSAWLKVAWINRRRTVVLLVRHGDRRALSLRIGELQSRFDQGRAYLIAR